MVKVLRSTLSIMEGIYVHIVEEMNVHNFDTEVVMNEPTKEVLVDGLGED